MKKDIKNLINELVIFENKVAELYGLFMQYFEEDQKFWEKIKIEEENHAIILDNAEKQFFKSTEFPEELIDISLMRAIEENLKLDKILSNFKNTVPTRKIAFDVALEVETCLPEYIYQKAMNKIDPSPLLKIIQKINGDEKNHIQKIKLYMESNNINL